MDTYFRHWLHEHTYPLAMACADIAELQEIDEAAWAKLVAECRQPDDNGLLPYSRAIRKHQDRVKTMLPEDAALLRMAQVLGTLTVNHALWEDNTAFWTAEAHAFLDDVPFLLEPALFPQPYGKLDHTLETWNPRTSFLACWLEMSIVPRWCLVRLHAEWTHRARNAIAVRLGVDPMELGEPEADTIHHPPVPQRLPVADEPDELYWEMRVLLSACRDVPSWVPWVMIRQYALAFGPFTGVGEDDLDILENRGDPLEEVFITPRGPRKRKR